MHVRWRAIAVVVALVAAEARATEPPLGTEEPEIPRERKPFESEKPSTEQPAAEAKPKISLFGIDDEAEPYEPPLVRASAGIILWPYLRTTIRIGRSGVSSGTRIDDAEETAGLPERSFSPWIEASVGGAVRFGLTALSLGPRTGDLTRAEERIEAGGRVLAERGDLIDIDFEYYQADAFVQWDVLRSRNFRIGVLGGARYIRISTRIRGYRADPLDYQSVKDVETTISPFFGGQIELEPFPLLVVYANVRYIDWSWDAIDLREQRTFELRLGAAVYIVEEILGVAMDFRFLSTFVDPSDGDDGKLRGRYSVDAGGVAITVTLRW